MNEFKQRFYDAYCYARSESACMKVAVGAFWIPNNHEKRIRYADTIFASNVNPDGYSCKVQNECYKAKVTGIYESCEETRKYCKSIHAEINLINKMKENFPDRDQVDLLRDGSVWVTRYPCVNCALEMIKHGLEKIYYCGHQEISDEVKGFFESAGVEYQWFPDYDFENNEFYPWWTDILYDNSYSQVSDRKFPVVVPSYNKVRDQETIYKMFGDMDDIYNYPIYIFVRESQKSEYLQNIQDDKREYIHIISLPDELISNAGAVRRESMKYMYHILGYRYAFYADDDLSELGYVALGVSSKSQQKISEIRKFSRSAKILSMWQIAMEYASSKYNVVYSGISVKSKSWVFENCKEESSMRLLSGQTSQFVCLDLQTLLDNGIVYKDNFECGWDDADFLIELLSSGLRNCIFPFIYYEYSPMNLNNWDYNSLESRLKDNCDKIMELHSDKDWVTCQDSKYGPRIKINFRKLRSQSKDLDNYKININAENNILNY